MAVKIIGFSGPSSSGKTTVAYILQRIFPNITYVLHADDFCKKFDQSPVVNGYLDCDGPDAVDFVRMAQVLDHIKSHEGIPPEDFKSWQDDVFPGQEEKALKTVHADLIETLKFEVERSGIDASTKLVLVDGFLLFHNAEIRKRLDLMLFFRLSHDVAKERRFSRQGYVPEAKPEDFWKTEDYFEKMVWRCYSEQHAFMFRDGDVEGEVDLEACQKAGVKVLPSLNVPVAANLTWAKDEILSGLKS
jgi:nicotinamide/nicotinate riboside kinase